MHTHTGVMVTVSRVCGTHPFSVCTHHVTCVFMHVVLSAGVTLRSSQAVNEVHPMDVQASVGQHTNQVTFIYYVAHNQKVVLEAFTIHSV